MFKWSSGLHGALHGLNGALVYMGLLFKLFISLIQYYLNGALHDLNGALHGLNGGLVYMELFMV